MNEPSVIGIPVGGAAAEGGTRDGSATGALGTRRVSAERPAAGAVSLSDGCRCGAGQAAAGGDRPAKLPAGDQPSRAGAATRNLPSDHVIEHAAVCPPGPIRTAAPAFGDAAAKPSAIFHLIAEPGRDAPAAATGAHLGGKASPGGSAPTPATGSHLEVGVRGRARVGREEPPPEVCAGRGEVRQPGRMLAFAAVAAMVVGSGFLVRGLTLADPVPPPLPPAWASRAVGDGGHRAPPMGYARPTRVSIARVGINADVLAVGLAGDGAVGVPPAGKPLTAAWYDRGPAPGQAGPAVITGHVDSRFAPGNRAAFYELGAVRPGDDVDVARADRRVAVFRVDSVAVVPKAGFPTRKVYGPTGYAALRLITCGGRYDRRTGYADNVIVYAHLIGSR